VNNAVSLGTLRIDLPYLIQYRNTDCECSSAVLYVSYLSFFAPLILHPENGLAPTTFFQFPFSSFKPLFLLSSLLKAAQLRTPSTVLYQKPIVGLSLHLPSLSSPAFPLNPHLSRRLPTGPSAWTSPHFPCCSTITGSMKREEKGNDARHRLS
jgi:hypothetical protein